MNIVTQISEWQKLRKTFANKTLGFVPTMGNLHDGHMSLCARSQAENDLTVACIFVNPTQFNEARDFQLYPRTIAEDKKMLVTQKVDYLFLPDQETMYPDQYQVKVQETELSQELEGEFRPGHFEGMLTVVLKLLNIVQPNRAYFGEKDFQQLLLIKKMAAALFLPCEIIPCKTVRAADGLALSSRNSRLSKEQREKAQLFPQLLQSHLTIAEIENELGKYGFKVDYIKEKWERRLGAVWLDEIRLIDNIAKL